MFQSRSQGKTWNYFFICEETKRLSTVKAGKKNTPLSVHTRICRAFSHTFKQLHAPTQPAQCNHFRLYRPQENWAVWHPVTDGDKTACHSLSQKTASELVFFINGPLRLQVKETTLDYWNAGHTQFHVSGRAWHKTPPQIMTKCQFWVSGVVHARSMWAYIWHRCHRQEAKLLTTTFTTWIKLMLQSILDFNQVFHVKLFMKQEVNFIT